MGMGSSPNSGSPPQKNRKGSNLSNEGRKLKERPADPAPPSNGGGWEGVDTNQSAQDWGTTQNDNSNNDTNNAWNNQSNGNSSQQSGGDQGNTGGSWGNAESGADTTSAWNNDAANGDNSGDWNGHQVNDSPAPADGGNVGPSMPGAWDTRAEADAADWNSGGALGLANSTGGRYDATPDGKGSWGNNEATNW